jgi:hypothetical protein
MRTLGRGVLAVGKALLAQVAVVGFWLALGLVLSLVFGVTGRFDRWVRTHNISPSLLVAIAVFLTVCAQQAQGSRRPSRCSVRQTNVVLVRHIEPVDLHAEQLDQRGASTCCASSGPRSNHRRQLDRARQQASRLRSCSAAAWRSASSARATTRTP